MGLTWFLLLLGVTSLCLGDDEHVVNYSSAEYDKNVPLKHHFIMFFAPWCGHCKRLKPTWDQLAEKHNAKDVVTVAKVDCTVETATCAKEDVTGYPTLKFFKPGNEEGIKYRGSRDLEALSKFVEEQLAGQEEEEKKVDSKEADPTMPVPTNGLVQLTDQTFNKFTEHGQHFVKFYAPWCGHCQRLAPIWEGLAKAYQYDTKVNIAKLDCTEHRNACSNMDVKGYPTLLWIRDGKKVEKFQGSRNHDDLKAFVDRMMKTEDEYKDSEKDKIPDTPKPKPTPKPQPTQTGSAVKMLTKDTYRKQLSTGLTFVKFFAPWCGHCKRLAPIWDQLANKFEGNDEVTIAKVDCTADNERSICDDEKVDGFPTMILYKNGKQLESYEDDRKLDLLYTFVMKHITEGKDEL